MKNLKPILLLFMVCMSACDVNRIPETQLSDQSFWRSENDLKTAATYLYTFLPTLPVVNDVWSDDAYATGTNTISDGSRLVPATTTDYNAPYQLIRAANNIIEKAPRGLEFGVPAYVVDSYIAEARFFRAWGHFQLTQKYGDVPLIMTTLIETSSELEAPATPREQVLDAIYLDLDLAVEKLSTPTVLGNAGYGRISKTAALALKARAALYEGTRSKFHKYGSPQKHLTIAMEASKAIIDSKEHGLFASYFNLFQYEGEGRANRENILVRQYGASLTESISTHNAGRNYQDGASSPTKALIDSYLMTDGLPISKSPLYKTPALIGEIFVNRDERLSASVMKRGDPSVNKSFFTVPNLTNFRTGFSPRKFTNVNDWAVGSYIDLPVIRYAEVLLTYAEAKFELTESITNADLDLSVNLLRGRGKVAPLTNELAAANGLSLREEIRRERRVELANEGFRYWDLIRWKTAEVELPKPVLGIYYFAELINPELTPVLTPDKFILVQEARFRSFNPQRDYYWPFPINELALNRALKQNPQW